MRRSPIKRTTGLRAKKPFGTGKTEAAKERDAERKLRKFRRRFHSPQRVFVVQQLTCIVPGCGRSPCDNAHGQAKESYRSINPLCRGHHVLSRNSFHGLGSQAAFEAHWLERHGLTWDYFADQTETHFQENGARVIQLAEISGEWRRFLADSPLWLQEAA